MTDYQRIAEAIEYIRTNFRDQPDLDTVAKAIFVSPFHFQRMFKEWAGVSPKKFLQYTSIQHAKQLLQQNATMAEASFETGLSGTGRLHDLFVSIEGMTPGEYKNGGKDLVIHYSFQQTAFGEVLIASTGKGICNLFFVSDHTEALKELHFQWPGALLVHQVNSIHTDALGLFQSNTDDLKTIKLHLKGTSFQLKVWEALLKIPCGQLTTYATLANTVHNPKASRAVGSAVGDNPVAFLIPCHRVIRNTGIIGDYHWGTTRKTAIIGWESARMLGE